MFGFLLLVIAAVVIGLAIAYWYLRRLEAERRRVGKEPRIGPFSEPYRPVDLTPMTGPLDSNNEQAESTGTPNEADVDGLKRRLAAIEPEHRPATEPAPAKELARKTPRSLTTDAGDQRDDLKQISGIGPKLERMLNANGIFQFRQIAAWRDAEIEAMDEQLSGFRGRIRRDDWVSQAKKLRDGP